MIHDLKKKTKWSVELDFHITSFIEFNELRFSDLKTFATKNSKNYSTKKMYRNTIRKQFNFANLKIDFMTITIETNFVSMRSLSIYDFNNLNNVHAWFKTRTFFESTKNNEFNFVYILKILNDDENEKNLLEHHESSLILFDEMIIIDDHDIALKQKLSDSKKKTRDLEIETVNNESMNHKSLFKIRILFKNLLKNDFRLSKKNVVSQNHFENRTKMLIYHDDHDIFNEKDFFEWQHWFFGIVNDLTPKISRKTIADMSKKIKKKLQTTQSKNEVAFISTDVNDQVRIDIKIFVNFIQ